MAVLLALPELSLAQEKPQAGPPGPEPGVASAPAPAGSIQWLKRKKRFHNIAVRIKRRVGQENWVKLRDFWRANIRDKVKPGHGRRMRSFVGFARRFAQALNQGRLDAFLARSKARWDARPVVAPPPPPR
jgi:hypothetical protein